MSFGNIFSKFVTYLLTLLTLSFLEVFKFNEVLTLILSYVMPFTLHLKKSLLYTNLSNNFSPRSFIFILSSNTHFLSWLLWRVYVMCLNYYFLYVNVQLVQYHLSKRLIFAPLFSLCSFVEYIYVDQFLGSLFCAIAIVCFFH